jgi:hypothetical protein
VQETDRAKTAEDCVEAHRVQITSLKDANRDLEEEMSDERTNLRVMGVKHEIHEKETASAIAELRSAVEKEVVSRERSLQEITQLTSRQGARAALSQVIAGQQMSLARLKEKNGSPIPPAPTLPSRGRKSRSDSREQQDNPDRPEDMKQQDGAGPEKITGNLDDKKTPDTPEPTKFRLVKPAWEPRFPSQPVLQPPPQSAWGGKSDTWG